MPIFALMYIFIIPFRLDHSEGLVRSDQKRLRDPMKINQ